MFSLEKRGNDDFCSGPCGRDVHPEQRRRAYVAEEKDRQQELQGERMTRSFGFWLAARAGHASKAWHSRPEAPSLTGVGEGIERHKWHSLKLHS